MFVQIERTPNPQTLKFIPGGAVSDRPNEFSQSDAASHPFLAAVFDATEVANVFTGTDFVSVTLGSSVDWTPDLRDKIIELVIAHEGNWPKAADRTRDTKHDDPVVGKIIDLLDSHVRPAVAADGGDITFRDYEGGVLILEMKGACAGCPSSTATLKHGIQNLMRHFVPEVKEVRAWDAA